MRISTTIGEDVELARAFEEYVGSKRRN